MSIKINLNEDRVQDEVSGTIDWQVDDPKLEKKLVVAVRAYEYFIYKPKCYPNMINPISESMNIGNDLFKDQQEFHFTDQQSVAFRFSLPENGPSTFDDKVKIVYYVQVEMMFPTLPENGDSLMETKFFSREPSVNLNLIPFAKKKMKLKFPKVEKEKFKVNIKVRGFTPGEEINLKVKREKDKKPLQKKKLIVTLEEYIGGLLNPIKMEVTPLRQVVVVRKEIDLDALGKEFNITLRIPPDHEVLSFESCNFVKLKYTLHIQASKHFGSIVNLQPKDGESDEIIIGSIPLQ